MTKLLAVIFASILLGSVVAYAAGVLPATRGGTGATSIPNCPNALTYNTSTHAFGCNTTLSTLAPTTTTTAAPTTTTVTTTSTTTSTTV